MLSVQTTPWSSQGPLASRPLAQAPGVGKGYFFYAEDTGEFFINDGASWQLLAGGGGGSVSWGGITGTLSNQTDLNNALALKAPLASPALTGVPTVPTAAPGTGTTQIASTAFVKSEIAAIPVPAAPAWGGITGTLSNQTDLNNALALKAPLASPALTGVPTAPTAAPGTSTTQLASTAFVEGEIAAIPAPAWGGITGTLSNQTDLNNALALKAPLASPALTGVPTAPTAALGSNDTTLATTAFVQASARNGVQFVYDPAAPLPDYSRSLYNDWATLCGAISTLPYGVVPIITFVRDSTIPAAGMPVTGWYMANAIWESSVSSSPLPAAHHTAITIPDGVLIDTLSQIDNGLYVTVSPTTAGGAFNWTTQEAALPTAPRTLKITNTSSLINTGSTAAIHTPGTGATFQFWIEQAYFQLTTSAAPFVNLGATDRFVAVQRNCGFRGSLPANWLEGSGSLLKMYGVDAFDAQNAGFTGNVVVPLATESAQNPMTTRGTRRQLIYTDSLPTSYYSPDVFTDWALLYKTWEQIQATSSAQAKDIVFIQTNPAVPLVIPAAGMPPATGGVPAGWRIGRGAVLMGPSISANLTTVVIEDGAVLVDVTGIGGGLALIGQSTTPCLDYSDALALAMPYLILDAGCVLRNTGTAPMLAWTRENSNPPNPHSILNIGLREQARFVQGTAPIVDVTPGGAYTSTAAIWLYGGIIDDNTLSSNDAAGTARIIPEVSNGLFSTAQAAVTGPALNDVGTFTVLSRMRVLITSAPVSTPYAPTAAEYVRIEPDGTNPVDITLPDANLCPCETITVKKVNADTTSVCTVSSATLIDGAATDVLPATPYCSRRYTSDGTTWWIS